MRLSVLAVVSTLLLSGCASMTQGECLTGNWMRVGYEDGAAGHPPSRLGNHEAACAAHGVGVDAQAYFDARERGLVEYCTPYGGFVAGRNGRTYQGVCSYEVEGGFLVGYADGRHVHDASQHSSRARSEVSTQDNRIRKLRRDIDRMRERVGKAGSSDERKDLGEELQALRGDLRRAERDLELARRQHELAERDLQRVLHLLEPRYRGGW
ncbi:DUF2799 domain-containing protein [Luteimonas sp. A478]